MKHLFFFLVILLIPGFLQAQNIKRRASLLVDARTDTAPDGKSRGVEITKIFASPDKQKSVLKEKDVIVSFNGKEIKELSELTQIVSKHREGDKFSCIVLRNGKNKKLESDFFGQAYEKSETHDVLYDEFPFAGGYIRTITDKPKSDKPLPAILFIQGYTCGSFDNADPKHPYIRLVKGLAEKGFAVMRVEKPGDGDCMGTPECEDIDFHTEIGAFREGLKKLQSYDFVDKNRIFIWGHSIGGIIAPVVANKQNIAGIVVYGTGIKPWREYLVEMIRVQSPVIGADPVALEKDMPEYFKLIYKFYIEKQSPEEISKDTLMHRLLKEGFMYDDAGRLFTRSYKYLQQIDDYNLTQYWSETDAHVLSMWGNCDFEAYSKYDQETIAEVVNKYHPNHGEFVEIDRTTHAFSKVNSMKHGLDNYTREYMFENFNNQVIEKTYEWMQKVLNERK